MRTGYHGQSTFGYVRTCVIRAARKLGMSQEKIEAIKQAFEDVGIIEQPATLKGTVSKYGGEGLPNVRLTATRYYASFGRSITGRSYSTLTDADGNYSLKLPEGTYSVDVSVSGYVPFYGVTQLEQSLEHVMNIPLVSRGSTSTLHGTVRDALTGQVIDGVLLEVRTGWDVHTGYTNAETLSQSDGTYSTHLVAGYYTAKYSKEGYITTSINNFVISSDETIRRDIILSQTTDNKYRVTLQWDANPSDLDSHLIGKLPDSGGNFHVYFSNRSAGYHDDDYVAVLDHDDTSGWGFETITFQMQPGDEFKYYVHWYSGIGTWSGSNAVVNLYKGTNLIGTYPVPDVDLHGYTAGRYWHVFDLTDGLDPIQPAPTDAISRTEPTLNTQSISYSQGAPYYLQKVR